MKKIFLFIIFFQLFNYQNLIAKDLWAEAKEGDKIILIRHALAPGGGDPPGFKIDDCKTQRNLDKVGIEQSKAIGKLFKKNKIPVDKDVKKYKWQKKHLENQTGTNNHYRDVKILQNMPLKIILSFLL